MSELELNKLMQSITPAPELRSRVISAAVEAAAERSMQTAAFDRRIRLIDGIRPDLTNEGEYNPDYFKNMVTRFTLCDPDDVDHLQGLVLSAIK